MNLNTILKSAKEIEKAAFFEAVNCHKLSVESFYKQLRASLDPALSLKSFTDPLIYNSFLKIGVPLFEETAGELYERILQGRNAAEKCGLIINDRSWRYLFEHSDKLWGAFTSTQWGKCFGEYDPRGHLENISGALFRAGSLQVLCSSTPTVGDKVAPEMKAAILQLKQKGRRWCYVNLQNIVSHDEGFRSRALMQLNKEFPETFYGITFTQDSSFFVDESDAPADEQYAVLMKEELLKTCNFTLENRIGSGDSGYYFPHGKKRWIEPLTMIVDMALKAASGCKRVAFRELVHLGIIRYYQLATQASLSTIACKEGIDRGAKVNAEILWALADNAKEYEKYIFSLLFARALLTRSRAILPDRVQQIAALLQHIPHKVAHDYLHDIGMLFGVESIKIEILQ